MEKRQVKATLSSDLVKHFQKRGMTILEIAKLTGLSESFISRVANRERSFTIDHLVKIERSVRQPLPLLLLEALSQESIPTGLLPLYQTTRSLLFSASELKHLLNGEYLSGQDNDKLKSVDTQKRSIPATKKVAPKKPSAE